jgi:glycosyltransferase involved in cell wall biosynthesis
MKIVYIIGEAKLYGSELHLFDLIKKLAGQNQIKLIAFSDGPLLDLIRQNSINIEIVIVKFSWMNGLFNLFKLKREIKRFAPNIVHSHQPIAILFGSLAAKLSNVKHIATIHSLPNVSSLEHTGLKRRLVYTFHCSVQFIAEALSDKSIFITFYNKQKYSFCKRKAIVIYNWVSDRFNTFEKNENEVGDFIRFISVSSINKGKGIIELLNIFKDLKDKLNYKLVIAGEGKEDITNEIKAFIIENNLQKNIEMAGYQTNLVPFYNNADQFILLAKDEAFGLVFIEAMQFGLPIICTDLPQLREIIPEGNIFINLDTGFDNDSINRISDVNYRNKIGLVNKNKAKTSFNMGDQIAKVEKLYREVIMTN